VREHAEEGKKKRTGGEKKKEKEFVTITAAEGRGGAGGGERAKRRLAYNPLSGKGEKEESGKGKSLLFTKAKARGGKGGD